MSILKINGLTKYYGKYKALENINLEIEKGKVFALIGPNGAGKTTLVKSILGLTKFKMGEIELNEKSNKCYKSHEHIAYFPEKFSFFPYFSVEGVLNFYGRMYGHKGSELKAKINEVLSMLEINDLRSKRITKISKGELQRTGIAATLLSNAEIYIFDEPFYGLDPIGIKGIKDLFRDLSEKGKTVIINSHILSEIEKIASSVGIINKGELLYCGDIKKLVGEGSLEDKFYSMIKGGER